MINNRNLVEIVGTDNVMDSPDALEGYSGDISFASRVRPRCVVKPGNAQEVQGIVTWANETGTPLVPISSGSPHFRGDTIPRIGGAVIVDLSRMKKIIRIDERNRVAMVEPGVTFSELQPELKKAGLSAYLPLCPRGPKSVLSSMLEREPITMPAHHWDSTDPFLCGEIIWGTGDKFRSGEAAGPDSIEDQWKLGNYQMTPFMSQFDENKIISGAQGTMGIITWATMKCRLLSNFSRTLLVPSENLPSLFDITYKLLRNRQCDHLFILNDLNLGCLLARDPDAIRSLREILPPWVLVVSFEGNGDMPEDKVAWQEADFREMVNRSHNDLQPTSLIPGVNGEDLSGILSRASEEPFWKLRYKGAFSELFFITTLDKTDGFVDAVSGLCRSKRFFPADTGVYIQPRMQGTSVHCEFDLYYDPANAAEADRVKWLVTEGAQTLAGMGAFFSRPYGHWAKVAYSRAADSAVMLKKLKKIFDPNDVMNPGQLCF